MVTKNTILSFFSGAGSIGAAAGQREDGPVPAKESPAANDAAKRTAQTPTAPTGCATPPAKEPYNTATGPSSESAAPGVVSSLRSERKEQQESTRAVRARARGSAGNESGNAGGLSITKFFLSASVMGAADDDTESDSDDEEVSRVPQDAIECVRDTFPFLTSPEVREILRRCSSNVVQAARSVGNPDFMLQVRKSLAARRPPRGRTAVLAARSAYLQMVLTRMRETHDKREKLRVAMSSRIVAPAHSVEEARCSAEHSSDARNAAASREECEASSQAPKKAENVTGSIPAPAPTVFHSWAKAADVPDKCPQEPDAAKRAPLKDLAPQEDGGSQPCGKARKLLTDVLLHASIEQKVKAQATSGRGKRVLLDAAMLDIQGQEGWSEARKRAWSKRNANPNMYYYRFNEPGEENKRGAFTADEERLLLDRVRDIGIDKGWGMIAMGIPGRVGYACNSAYRKMIERGAVSDERFSFNAEGELVMRKRVLGQNSARLTLPQLQMKRTAEQTTGENATAAKVQRTLPL